MVEEKVETINGLTGSDPIRQKYAGLNFFN